jgi:hypothetical protein
MKTFHITFAYEDRSKGREHHSVHVEASSLPGAVAKAAREYVKKLDRKQRFDMNKHGLEIKAVHVEGAEGGEKAEAKAAGAE